MSDIMLEGILLMPPALWSDEPISIDQRYQRYIQAAEKIQLLTKAVCLLNSMVEGGENHSEQSRDLVRKALDH